MFKSILVAVDGSTHAKAAVEYGGRLAPVRRSRICSPITFHWEEDFIGKRTESRCLLRSLTTV